MAFGTGAWANLKTYIQLLPKPMFSGDWMEAPLDVNSPFIIQLIIICYKKVNYLAQEDMILSFYRSLTTSFLVRRSHASIMHQVSERGPDSVMNTIIMM